MTFEYWAVTILKCLCFHSNNDRIIYITIKPLFIYMMVIVK